MIAQANDAFFRWDWVVSHLDDIWAKVAEHLVLTGLSLIIGLVISAALALVALRFRRSYAPITWATGVLYTIPSLALFAFLVPITGFGIVTSLIGLVSYTLLILIRTIVSAIDGVDPAVREAADAMGYGRRRLLLEIEIPLALPVIVAGIRIATVTTVGLVTVTALVGQGGAGFFILDGLNRFFSTEIVLGTALSVLIAITLDVALITLERLATPWVRRGASG